MKTDLTPPLPEELELIKVLKTNISNRPDGGIESAVLLKKLVADTTDEQLAIFMRGARKYKTVETMLNALMDFEQSNRNKIINYC